MTDEPLDPEYSRHRFPGAEVSGKRWYGSTALLRAFASTGALNRQIGPEPGLWLALRTGTRLECSPGFAEEPLSCPTSQSTSPFDNAQRITPASMPPTKGQTAGFGKGDGPPPSPALWRQVFHPTQV